MSQVLEEVKAVGNVSLVAKKHQIPRHSIYNWARSMNVSIKKKDLEVKNSQETKKLKKEIEDLRAKCLIMEDLLKKTYQIWSKD
jgi:hypothetical protein